MRLRLYRAVSLAELESILSDFYNSFKHRDKFFVDDPKYILDRIWSSKTFNGLSVKDSYAYLICVDVEFINGFKPKVIKHGNYNVVVLRKSQYNVAYRVLNVKLISILSTRY